MQPGAPFASSFKASKKQRLHSTQVGGSCCSPGCHGWATGLWPQIDQGQWLNGGIPQLANLSAHLESLEEGLDTWMPDPDWDGLAVLDCKSPSTAPRCVVVLRLRGHRDLVAFQGKNGTLSGIGSGSSTRRNSTSTRTPATRWCGASTLAGPRKGSWRKQRKVGKPRRLSGWCRRSRRASGRGPGPSGVTSVVRAELWSFHPAADTCANAWQILTGTR